MASGRVPKTSIIVFIYLIQSFYFKQSFHQSIHEPHQDLSHFRLCEVRLACS